VIEIDQSNAEVEAAARAEKPAAVAARAEQQLAAVAAAVEVAARAEQPVAAEVAAEVAARAEEPVVVAVATETGECPHNPLSTLLSRHCEGRWFLPLHTTTAPPGSPMTMLDSTAHP